MDSYTSQGEKEHEGLRAEDQKKPVPSLKALSVSINPISGPSAVPGVRPSALPSAHLALQTHHEMSNLRNETLDAVDTGPRAQPMLPSCSQHGLFPAAP